MKTNKLKAAAAVILCICASSAMAVEVGSTCGENKSRVESALKKTAATECRKLNTDVPEKSPYMIGNPDAGCNFSEPMLGLPGFGEGGFNFDVCEIVEDVYEDVMGDLEQQAQRFVDDQVDKINDKASDVSGGYVDDAFNPEVDMNDVWDDNVDDDFSN